ncbi:NfeD family protein [Microcoleus sp. FACHB-68]|jgi:triacylglycerol esterase/lipase EstA (alpha/beta hydrolase family)|uniref:NfeD family protein n=1 Tax=Microcoleus sp. FACHB-68 TaxID=2692826 RepID=UPI0016846303|nr:NfeD family protein [Microcoleus sp. FACHB-68]MBD1939115.1 NfeD family protein [Microcoleus sp. FACHB-68]MBW4681810.1 NfeD family protein [Microcoleus vaginatus WJT46-NPBG5]
MDTLFTDTVKMFPQPLLGIVEQAIAYNQRGRVKFDGTYWPARFYNPDCQATVSPNQFVNVVAREGITLLVVPIDPITLPESPIEMSDSEAAFAGTESGRQMYWEERLSRRTSVPVF